MSIESEQRPLIERVSEKILGVLGVLFGIGLVTGGLSIVGAGLRVPMIASTGPLFLGVVMVVGGVVVIGLIWRHFTRHKWR